MSVNVPFTPKQLATLRALRRGDDAPRFMVEEVKNLGLVRWANCRYELTRAGRDALAASRVRPTSPAPEGGES